MGFGGQSQTIPYIKFIECPRVTSGSTATKLITAFFIYFTPIYVPRLLTVNQVSIITIGQGGNVKMGIYPAGTLPYLTQLNPPPVGVAAGQPVRPSVDSPFTSSLLFTAGPIPVAATTTFMANMQLPQGIYWVGIQFDSAGGSFIRAHALTELAGTTDIPSGANVFESTGQNTLLNGGHEDPSVNGTIPSPVFGMTKVFGYLDSGSPSTGSGIVPAGNDNSDAPHLWFRVASVDE